MPPLGAAPDERAGSARISLVISPGSNEPGPSFLWFSRTLCATAHPLPGNPLQSSVERGRTGCGPAPDLREEPDPAETRQLDRQLQRIDTEGQAEKIELDPLLLPERQAQHAEK